MSSQTGKLAHPLPVGMRDLLPEEARRRRELGQQILDYLALHGYQLVTPPAFELASVLERGLVSAPDDAWTVGVDSDDLLRFIEPDSGEVAVLRPDMTPQVAPIVATRLGDREPPFRLAYEGTVVRRRSSRAKKHRQIPQVGVELCGAASPEGDLELLALAAGVLREVAGLDRFTIDLSDAGIVRELLAGMPGVDAHALSTALAKKDEASLQELSSGIEGGARLLELSRLSGGREAILDAIAILRRTSAEAPARRLLALFDAAAERGLGEHLSADPAEVRGFSYYTGVIFSIYAPGPGEPIGGGGRYDDLLSRYGAPRPAVGLGLDLDALGWALRSGPDPHGGERGVVVVGPADDPRAGELRRRGVAAVTISDAAKARTYAASWRFALVWDDARSADEVVRVLEER